MKRLRNCVLAVRASSSVGLDANCTAKAPEVACAGGGVSPSSVSVGVCVGAGLAAVGGAAGRLVGEITRGAFGGRLAVLVEGAAVGALATRAGGVAGRAVSAGERGAWAVVGLA